jgi:hypothetical protein
MQIRKTAVDALHHLPLRQSPRLVQGTAKFPFKNLHGASHEAQAAGSTFSATIPNHSFINL